MNRAIVLIGVSKAGHLPTLRAVESGVAAMQGWAPLNAHNVSLTPSLRGLERHLVDPLWTMFDPEGVAMIRRAGERGEVA